MNQVLISMDKEMNFRAYTVLSTEMVEKMRITHDTTPTASAALGRTIMCTSLMGLMLKGDESKVTVIIKGNGEAGQILVVADSKGIVKGYIQNPNVDLPLNDNGKLNVGAAVGPGNMTVIKDLGLKEPYIGQSDLITGEIAEDFTAYFAYSEQQPSSVLAGVLVDTDHSIKAAGGCIIQMLPQPDEDVLTKLEHTIKTIPSITDLIVKAENVHQVHDAIFESFEMLKIGEHEVDYQCDCSWDGFERGLISLGKEELGKIYQEDEQAELVCQFCRKKYLFDKVKLKDLLKSIE